MPATAHMMTLAIIYLVLFAVLLACVSFLGLRGALWDRAARNSGTFEGPDLDLVEEDTVVAGAHEPVAECGHDAQLALELHGAAGGKP